MAEIENHFTVFIRLPFERGVFIDPPPVSWSSAKERALWDVISRQAKGNDIDWAGLAEKLDVTQSFLLQQAAWLYERQLSQVRAQMKKVGARPSATSSPAPGSIAGSMIGGQTMKRGGSGGSRVPSRLSLHTRDGSTTATDTSVPGTPSKSRTSLPFRAPSVPLASQLRAPAVAGSPISRQSSKEAHTPTYSQSRRESAQQHILRSPAQGRPTAVDSSESDDEPDTTASRIAARRQNPSATPRRALLNRRDPEARRHPPTNNDEDDDEDDSQTFLPFASKDEPVRDAATLQDPSATLRGGFIAPTPLSQRPTPHRRTTSERIVTTAARPPQPMTSSASSGSSGPTPTTTTMQQPAQPQPSTHIRAAAALSPRQRAALAALSPRHRPGNVLREGSDTSPSMGSSFSDLDDASVTQSALEEALLSNMARGNSNGSSTTGNGGGTGMASRVSGISQALRSRYFDAQQ